MQGSIVAAAAALALAATLAGIAYLAIAVRCVAVFGSRQRERNGEPSVTIFKPLCGAEPALYENLCSFCDQDYRAFEVIFGAADPSDPALTIAQRVQERFKALDILLVTGGDARAANPKVANLLNMVGRATGDVFVIADSDMRVDSTYLRSIVAPFADPNVGAVTCLYSGVPLKGTPSSLGAMFVNEYFAPSVLVALRLGDLSFGLGASIAVRRSVLSAIGGFEALAPHLADDYMLGKLVVERGLAVALSPYVVQNVIYEPTLAALWYHELRWARTIRAVRPIGYAFSGITYPLPFGLLYLMLAHNVAVGLGLILVAGGLRVALHHVTRIALRVKAPYAPWLIPLRDVLAFAIWGASFFGRGVRWRAQTFALEAGDRLKVKKRPGASPSKRPA